MNREKFEQLCVERMSEWRSRGNELNDNGSPLTVESLCWKDENGNYGVLALNAAWWGFSMALECTTQLWLYAHEDGRHAVGPTGAAFTVKDPAWHRVGPCEVHDPVMGALLEIAELVAPWLDEARAAIALAKDQP